MCLSASMAEDAHLPGAIEKALTAKYFASRAVSRAAADTVQVLQKVLGKSFCRKFKIKD